MTLRFRSPVFLLMLLLLGVAETAHAQSWFRQRTYDRRTAPVQPASAEERQALEVLTRRYASKIVPIADVISATGLPLAIPDNSNAVTSKITVPAGEAVTGLAVSVSIVHQARGDLRVRLVAPGGQTYTLSDQSGGSEDDLLITNRTVTIPAEGTIHGTWTLSVQDRENRNTGRVVSWSMHVTRIESAVIDLTMSLESTPDEEGRLVYERIVGHFADAVYEMTNGAHRIGRVRVFTGGRNFGSADVRWGLKGTPHVPRNGGVGVVGGHVMMYETFTKTILGSGDTASSYWSMNLLKDELGAGYTMAHEWGHYFLGLYDESTPHTCGAKDEVKPSIMANQWKATEGSDRFDWLNLSIARGKGGDFEIASSTCQYFAHGTGAWPTLARTPEEDPRDGTSMKFQTLGPRIYYPELALVAPTGTTRRRLDLPSPMARASLEVMWMTSRTVLEIVLDRSGSMAGPKLAKAKAAAKLLVDQAVLGETSIGLTVFDHTVTDLLPIVDLDSVDVREKIKAAIDEVVTAGTTAIGDAAAVALKKLQARKDDAETRVVFLLTDGQNNAGREPETVVADFTESRVPLFTFGFGTDVDEKSLSAIAEATGGRYYTSPTTLAALTTAFREATQVAVSSTGAGAGELSPTPSRPATRMIPVDSAVARLQVSVVAPAGVSAGQISLYSPAGTAVLPMSVSTASGETLLLFDVAQPEDGAWRIAATAASGTPVVTYGVTAVQSSVGYVVNSGVRGSGFTVTTPGPVVVESRLTRRRAIAGADVAAVVTTPVGATTSFVMNDRGVFPDLMAGDGHYAGLFEPAGTGVYAVAVEFSNPRGEAYETYAGATLTPGAVAAPVDELIAESFVRSETIHITVATAETTAAPRVLVPPASVETAVGQTAMFSVGAVGTPAPAFQWQRRRAGTTTWIDLHNGDIDGLTVVGADTDTLRLGAVQTPWFRDQFRVRLTNSRGEVASEPATLLQTPGTIALDRAHLTFVVTPGPGGTVTPAQVVGVIGAGDVPVTWMASADVPWLRISPAGGQGSGRFVVSVVPDAVVSNASGTILVQSVPAGPTQVVKVDLQVRDSGANQPPVGQLDTPVQGAVVAGSIAVTGWALDDVGISRVEIWRDRVVGDDAPAFREAGHPADGKVFVANAVFVEGTRPDVEVAYATLPASHRAGWGYLLLTWGFPSSNGPFTLTAVAWDMDGQSTILGQRTIVVDNASSTRPFGAIDVPAYGGTFAGHDWTYGWALTPNAGCTISGGQRVMTINSVPASETATFGVTYGSHRPDIAAAFPGMADSLGAGGAAAFDSRLYANGIYQIGWLVYDSCGNGEGIGSRFFQIANDGVALARPALQADPRSASAPASLVVLGHGPSFSAVGTRVDAPIGVAARDRAAHREPLWLVRGIGEPEVPLVDGARVWLSQTGRLELHATRPGNPATPGLAYEAYLIVDGVKRPLPLGSSFDTRTGSFYWQPVAGFLGTYLISIETIRDGRVERTLETPVEVGPEAEAVLLQVDQAACNTDRCLVAGWTLDPQRVDEQSISHVHVWATRSDVAGMVGEPRFVGAARLGEIRSDVAHRYGRQFEGAGYLVESGGLPEGEWELTVSAWSVRTGRWEAARVVRVTVR